MLRSISGRLRTHARKLGIIIGAIALMILAWANLLFHINADTNAKTIQEIRDQIEGRVKQDIGILKPATKDLTNRYLYSIN